MEEGSSYTLIPTLSLFSFYLFLGRSVDLNEKTLNSARCLPLSPKFMSEA